MSVPGWYPDPAGDPGRFRWWDGARWSTQTTADPSSAPPVTGPTHASGGRSRAWLPVLAIVVVVALGLAWALRPSKDGAAESTDSSTPTISAWNETPEPTPSSPSPSSPSPSSSSSSSSSPSVSVPATPDPSGGRPVACDVPAGDQLGAFPANQGRFAVGKLSMPVPAGWNGPQPDSRMPMGRDTRGYVQRVADETALGWQSAMNLSVGTFDPKVDLVQMAATLTQCLVTSGFYTSVTVTVGEYRASRTTVSGRPAVLVSTVFNFSDPRLKTKGSAMRLVLVAVDDATVQIFFGVVPKEKADLVALVDATAKDLRVS